MKNTLSWVLCLLCTLVLVCGAALTACNQTPTDINDGEGAHDHDHDHDHDTPAVLDVSHTTEKDNTLTLTVKDHDGTVLFTKKGLSQKAISETVTDSVFSLGWATGSGANEYEKIYCDRQNCQVSQVFTSPFASDGARVVLPQGNNKDGYSVLIRDVFDDKGYSKTYPLLDAYLDGDKPVIFGGKMVDETHASVSYFVGANGVHRIVQFDLYADESTETTTTKK